MIQNEFCHENAKSYGKKQEVMCPQKSLQGTKWRRSLVRHRIYTVAAVAPRFIDYHEVSVARNMKNFQAAEWKKLWISRDALYNFYLMAPPHISFRKMFRTQTLSA
jgi:hypothetical protein